MNPKEHKETYARRISYAMLWLGISCGCIVGTQPLHAATPTGKADTTIAAVVDKPLAPLTNDAPEDQPTPQHTWVPGHWRWQDGAYVWETGRWEVPPIANATWVAPQWQAQGTGFVLKAGYWEQAAADPVASASTETTTKTPPPPAQRETITERPSATHVWIGGYWTWQDSRYVWVSGKWETPPRPQAVWIAPRWESRGDNYVFVPGYWRDASAQSVVPATAAPPMEAATVVTAPPPLREEVIYVRPSPRHVWVNGYWAWRGGHYVWVAGHWVLPPRGYTRWIQPRWERRGGTYVFIEGRWGR